MKNYILRGLRRKFLCGWVVFLVRFWDKIGWSWMEETSLGLPNHKDPLSKVYYPFPPRSRTKKEN